MADAADDVKSTEITPEDFEGEEKVTPEAEPSTAEQEPAEDKDSEVETEGKAEETPPEKPLTPKSENRFQTLANENRDLKRQVEQLTAQSYQPATEQELIDEVNPETGENYNRLEAKFESYRQQQELDKYNGQVAESQSILGTESYRVMQDFPIFNPDSEQYDAELGAEAAELLEANLIRDPNVPEIDPVTGQQTGQGIIIGSNVSPYQLYKTLARAQGISTTKGQLKGQQAAEKMLANADTASSTAPAKKPVDPVLALWESDN